MFRFSNRILILKNANGRYNHTTRKPWPEIFNSPAATAGKISPSPLQIRRSSKSAVIQPQNAASLAAWQRKTIKGVPAIVRLLHRVRL